jgi:hypothetical protein
MTLLTLGLSLPDVVVARSDFASARRLIFVARQIRPATDAIGTSPG